MNNAYSKTTINLNEEPCAIVNSNSSGGSNTVGMRVHTSSFDWQQPIIIESDGGGSGSGGGGDFSLVKVVSIADVEKQRLGITPHQHR